MEQFASLDRPHTASPNGDERDSMPNAIDGPVALTRAR